MNEGKPTAKTVATNGGFDSVTQTLVSFFRGGGIGDYGECMRWQFDEWRDRLTLLATRRTPDCDKGDNDPTKFPLAWKTEK